MMFWKNKLRRLLSFLKKSICVDIIDKRIERIKRSFVGVFNEY
jgi:hypothetical protein